MELVVIASIVLQLSAGVLALRLIVFTDRNWAWTLLSAGIFAMAFRRTHTLYEFYVHGLVPELSYEILGLGISILIFIGTYLIGPLLRDMKNSAQQIADNEERYRTVALFTHDWEYWMSPEGKYLYVSPACEKISGYTPQEFIDDPLLLFRLVHPEDRENVTVKMSILENMQITSRFDCRLLHKDGSSRWIVHNSIPVTSENGTYLGIRGSVRDIDHRKRIEAELKESRALYQGLIENSRSMVLRLDAMGRVTYACDYALTHFEKTPEELLGRELPEIFQCAAGPLDAEDAEKLRLFLATGQPLELEIDVQRSDGMIHWGEWVGTAVKDEAGYPYFFICVGIDVTRRKALDKIKEDVSRIVRHDLKSPLSGIIGIPNVMKEDENLTPRQVELLKAVEDAGTVMLDLINDSLNLYKLETGTYQFNMTSFDLLDLIKTIGDHLQASRKNKTPIILTINGTPAGEEETVPLFSDRPLVFSLLSNILKNALEASEAKPVCVDMLCNGNCVISISNAGVVPEEIRKTFFDKYVTSGKHGGTGLGTYSARLIANQLGGSIDMRSSSAEGTRVTITLPDKAD